MGAALKGKYERKPPGLAGTAGGAPVSRYAVQGTTRPGRRHLGRNGSGPNPPLGGATRGGRMLLNNAGFDRNATSGQRPQGVEPSETCPA